MAIDLLLVEVLRRNGELSREKIRVIRLNADYY